ncbi:MAG: hypothetical protein ACFCUT_20525 [Kiloniellaceae bacterium]
MIKCADKELVIAKLLSQGAERREGLDSDTSLWFCVWMEGKRISFCIPQPLVDGGYTEGQLAVIENEIVPFDLELLPMDPHLIH